MSNDDNATPGRKLYQNTKDGTSSAGSVGTGGTGVSGTDQGYDEAVNTPWNAGNAHSAGRTDDLLSPGDEADQEGNGFVSGTSANDLGNSSGTGAGNRQSDRDGDKQSLSGGGRPSDPTGLQGAAGNEGSASYPGESDQSR
ncbi:hypothetical protein IP91_02691 [Pseudoduganella lurida]|uniref:Uncharacterized protein n=1 Tax=Pseudoduganella lurida TaxID=1036180 RepID=A0A562R8R9_9BURK|nr:hypothetical protein [Pseudoduganella lurida]TWI65283.1 hypothetical protein IP91_02691 [Pseudoduganella lurida]